MKKTAELKVVLIAGPQAELARKNATAAYVKMVQRKLAASTTPTVAHA